MANHEINFIKISDASIQYAKKFIPSNALTNIKSVDLVVGSKSHYYKLFSVQVQLNTQEFRMWPLLIPVLFIDLQKPWVMYPIATKRRKVLTKESIVYLPTPDKTKAHGLDDYTILTAEGVTSKLFTALAPWVAEKYQGIPDYLETYNQAKR